MDKPERSAGEIFNIGSVEEVTINELAQAVLARTGSTAGIAHIPYSEAYAPGFEDMRRRVPDTNKIQMAVGWQPTRALTEILEPVTTRFPAAPATTASPATVGNVTLTGGGGNDTIVGGGGIDTAAYTATINTAGITDDGAGHFVVATGGSEGTDTLSGVEKIDGAGTPNILLVGNGGYATIQAAVDAAADGDIIEVAAGTYTEDVTVTGKALTIDGVESRAASTASPSTARSPSPARSTARSRSPISISMPPARTMASLSRRIRRPMPARCCSTTCYHQERPARWLRLCRAGQRLDPDPCRHDRRHHHPELGVHR